MTLTSIRSSTVVDWGVGGEGLSVIPRPTSTDGAGVIRTRVRGGRKRQQVSPLLSLLFDLIGPFSMVFIFRHLSNARRMTVPSLQRRIIITNTNQSAIRSSQVRVINHIQRRQVRTRILRNFIYVMTGRGFSTLHPTRLIMSMLHMFRFVVMRFVHRRVSPILSFFLLHFKRLIMDSLRFMTSVHTISQFITRSRFSSLHSIQRFIITRMPGQYVGSKVRRREFRRRTNDFLFRLVTKFMSVISRANFTLSGFITINPIRSILSFDLHVRNTRSQKVAFHICQFRGLSVIRCHFLILHTRVFLRDNSTILQLRHIRGHRSSGRFPRRVLLHFTRHAPIIRVVKRQSPHVRPGLFHRFFPYRLIRRVFSTIPISYCVELIYRPSFLH